MTCSMDIYQKLRADLLERLSDKDSTVRVSAATALCRFSQTEQPEHLEDDQELLTVTLAECMAQDQVSLVAHLHSN
jgi:condensin complex subunit 3